jgi:hypothetical protein
MQDSVFGLCSWNDGWYDSKKKTAAILQFYKIIRVDITFRITYLFYGTCPSSHVKNNTKLIKHNLLFKLTFIQSVSRL